MAQVSIHRSQLAYYPETVVCEAPADWDASGTLIEHISADPASIGQTFIPDPTLELRALSVGSRYNVQGIRNTDMTVGVKLHGTGVVTDPGGQVEPTALGTLLEHCMGGIHRGTSHTVTGGSTTVVSLDSVTGVVKGCIIGFQDTTAPLAKNLGKVHPRRVIDIDDADPFTVTLSEALPFTPANGDLAHGAITAYANESVLEDSVAPAVKTFSWWHSKERVGGGAEMIWHLQGCVASFEVQGLDRGQLPSLNLKIMAANFKHGNTDGLTNVAWTQTPEGHAQLSMGRDVLFTLGTYANSALSEMDINKCAFAVGFERTRVETITEKTHDFEGLASYSFKPAPSKFSVTLLPYRDNEYTELAARTQKRVTLYQPGDGSGAGKGWCIHMACAQIAATPKRADVGDVNGQALELQAMEPDDVVDGGDTVDLEKANFLIAIF